MAASRFRALYDSGASVDHQALKASLDCCLASRRRWASDGMAPGGSGCKQPALARPSASSLPGMLVCPGIQRTCTFPCEVASSWNLVNLSCDESAGLPRRQLATARLSVQTTTSLRVSPRRRAARRPSRAPVASASKTSDAPKRPDPWTSDCLSRCTAKPNPTAPFGSCDPSD